MSKLAVDTNVLAIANRQHQQAGEECVFQCGERLVEITRDHVVLLDRTQQIISEYRRYASPTGTPGLGDAFLRWLWNNRANPDRCDEVDLTPRPGNPEDFDEFPASLRRAGFDRNDRKFVAVAIAGSNDPVVVNGVDRDYARHYAGLQAEGVEVEFLCPSLCAPAATP